MKTGEPPFLTLARKPDLDQETAFTICSMISSVGSELVEKWDWNWLDGERHNYRSMIDLTILDGAWELLFKREVLNLCASNDKRIATIVPLEGLINLRNLSLNENVILDLWPVSSMVGLRSLSCRRNRISDLAPICNLQSLEALSLAENPIASFRVLEELPKLRELSLSTEQVARFAECKRLPHLRKLEITGEGKIESCALLPEMPALKFLKAHGLRDLRGIERFHALENMRLTSGSYSSLEALRTLREVTHVDAWTKGAVELTPLVELHRLRYLNITSPEVRGLAKLSRLPVLHTVHIKKETACDSKELAELQSGLTPWSTEFRTDTKSCQPSLELQVVDQETFDYYDAKMPYGITENESNVMMLAHERNWLVEEITDALEVRFEEKIDFDLPFMAGMLRSDRLVIFSVSAYEAFRDIVTIVQRILCTARNNWIIYCQSLLREGPEEQEIPEGIKDFIVWIYPDKIMVTKEHAEAVQKLIDWKN